MNVILMGVLALKDTCSDTVPSVDNVAVADVLLPTFAAPVTGWIVLQFSGIRRFCTALPDDKEADMTPETATYIELPSVYAVQFNPLPVPVKPFTFVMNI